MRPTDLLRPLPLPLRIAILGAESTGKSTLAAALAAHYGTLWVPEYLREFVEAQERTPQEHEQLLIAQTQVAHEEAAARLTRTYLFCDTTPLMTALYSRHYWARVDADLDVLAKHRRYDFCFVTAPDYPWVPDGLQRESEEVRERVHNELIATLHELGIPFQLVSGEHAQRVRQVIDALSV
jgi:NadR type nicotinamide-nucleotide adenylyltransferase